MLKKMNLFGMVFILFSTITAQNILRSDPYNITYEPNIILLKFNDSTEMPSTLGKGIGNVVIGIASIDNLFSTYKIEAIDKMFKNVKEPIQKKMILLK